MASPLTEAPIFVVGAGRSGTTLLRTLLAAHPRIAMTPETHFMRFAERQAGGLSGLDGEVDAERFWPALEAQRRFGSIGVAAGRVRAIAATHGSATYRDALAGLLAAYAEREGKPRAGEKTPGHYRDTERLLSWFPDARILYITRDPRAVTASALVTPWVEAEMAGRTGPRFSLARRRGFHVAALARDWRHVYGEVLPRWRDDPRVLDVSYEALVADVEAETRRVCGFLDETWTSDMIERRGEVAGSAVGGYGEWTTRHEAKASAPVTASGLERWRERLSRGEVATIEALCGAAMTALGYEPASTPAERRRAGLAARAEHALYRREKQARRVAEGLAARFAPGLIAP